MSRRSGYTFVELMVSLALGSLILGPLIAMWIGASRAERSLQARLDLFKATSEIMSRVSRDVLASGGVRTVTLEGTTATQVALLARGGKVLYYALDGEAKQLVRHVRDLIADKELEAESISAVPATVVLWEAPGGAVGVRVTVDEDLVLTTSLCPRGW